MSLGPVLSLFGGSFGSFPVPVEATSAVARRGGQGRPKGRRGTRLALDGAEHGRKLGSTATIGKPSRATRAAVALLALSVGLTAALPTLAREQRREDAVAAAVDESSARFGLPAHWIRLVLDHESGGEVRAVSPKGAMGLMQLMPSTWRDMSVELALGDDPFEPRSNVLAGAAYLRRMYDRYGSPGFLAAYNAGPGRYDRYLAGSASLPSETRNYVARLAPRLNAASGEQRASAWRSAGLFVFVGSDMGGRAQQP